MRDLVIVGAGLAGLTAAALASKAGLEVEVLESGSAPGGRADTQRVEGSLFNLGPHALYQGGEAERILNELGVRTSGGVPRGTGVFTLGGRVHRLPGSPWSLLTAGGLTASDKLALARAFVLLGRSHPNRWLDRSFASWLDETVGSVEHVRAVFEMLGRVATYTNAPDITSAGVVLRQMLKALNPGVLYLDGGWKSLVEQLADIARANGAAIRNRVRATAVSDGAVNVVTGPPVAARAVVLAVPPHHAASLTGETFPELTSVRAQSLTLVLDEEPERHLAFGADEPFYLSHHSRWARLAPEGHHLLHAAEYLSADRRRGRRQDLERWLDLVLPQWRARTAERYHPSLTVAYAHPHVQRSGAGVRTRSSRPGVWLAGDWVGAEGWLADRAIASARAAVTDLIDELGSEQAA